MRCSLLRKPWLQKPDLNLNSDLNHVVYIGKNAFFTFQDLAT